MQRALAIATAGLAGCFTVRAGAGLASSTEGDVSVQLTGAVGFGGSHGGYASSASLGLGKPATTRTSAITLDHVVWTRSRDDNPGQMFRVGGRFGWRERSSGTDEEKDAAVFLGASAAYLFVVSFQSGATREHCLYFGLGSETRHAVGVEAWVDVHRAGHASLGAAMASLGVVYQYDWYARGSECGD